MALTQATEALVVAKDAVVQVGTETVASAAHFREAEGLEVGAAAGAGAVIFVGAAISMVAARAGRVEETGDFVLEAISAYDTQATMNPSNDDVRSYAGITSVFETASTSTAALTAEADQEDAYSCPLYSETDDETNTDDVPVTPQTQERDLEMALTSGEKNPKQPTDYSVGDRGLVIGFVGPMATPSVNAMSDEVVDDDDGVKLLARAADAHRKRPQHSPKSGRTKKAKGKDDEDVHSGDIDETLLCP